MPQCEERYLRGDSCTQSSFIGCPNLHVQCTEASCLFLFRPSLTLRAFLQQGLPLSTRSRQASLRGEWVNMALLVVLYAMQGVPLGLTLGSMCAPLPLHHLGCACFCPAGFRCHACSGADWNSQGC